MTRDARNLLAVCVVFLVLLGAIAAAAVLDASTCARWDTRIVDTLDCLPVGLGTRCTARPVVETYCAERGP